MSRRSTADTVARLLAMIPWIASQPGGATIDEVCERFSITPAQLRSDLEIMNVVGVAPQTPDTMVEVTIADEWVDIRPQWFTKPPALTAEQGLALVAAGRSLLGVPGVDPTGPLARALANIEQALNVEPGRHLVMDLGPVDPEIYDTLRTAAAQRGTVAIRYYSHGRDEVTERIIEPWRVFAESGAWYTEAWCTTAGDRRVFRLERIAEAHPGTEPATVEPAPELLPGQPLFTNTTTNLEATLVVEPVFAWAVEQWNPVSTEELPDGRMRVTVAAGSPRGLERLLVQLGPAATLEWCSDPSAINPAAVANRIRERYRRGSE